MDKACSSPHQARKKGGVVNRETRDYAERSGKEVRASTGSHADRCLDRLAVLLGILSDW